ITNKRLERGLYFHKLIHPKQGKHKTKYRAISQSQAKFSYRRVDAQLAVEKGINIRYQQKWQRVDDHAEVELWIHLEKRSAHVGLRLSDKNMRHRMYKKDHLKASLRPTIAYCMAWLSEIDPDDVFLDPFCGAGTIIIERAQAGAYTQLYASDISDEAITNTQNNLNGRYQPVTVRLEDATKLSHQTSTIHKIVSNLPFGKQISTEEQLKDLYPKALKEMERILTNNGKIVLLIHDLNLLRNAVNSTNTLTCDTIYSDIKVLGESAHIAVITKK
ncbi:methyltransferase domain-containing protein, partial [candidate division WWE3 bacterium]|nr:methyltransferase domain-containing protein [candidate division WWE3 bacterium]